MSEFDDFFTKMGITDLEMRNLLADQAKMSAFEIALEPLRANLTESEKLAVKRVTDSGNLDDDAVKLIFHGDRQKLIADAMAETLTIIAEAIHDHKSGTPQSPTPA